jgi:glycosyltransferase involved in cell wall biosynthesis
MKLSFVAPTTTQPSGGVAMIFEFASTMAARGHEVYVHHGAVYPSGLSALPCPGPEGQEAFLQADAARSSRAATLADVVWFDFAEGVEHRFLTPGAVNFDELAEADVFFAYYAGMPASKGLPVIPIQGYRMLPDAIEAATFLAPCPKILVASWLTDIGRNLGAPAEELIHIPLGIRHNKYRLQRPVSGRNPTVSFCFSEHPRKGAPIAIEVLERAARAEPKLQVASFGVSGPPQNWPSCWSFSVNPPQETLITEIYNSCRVFLCTSDVEGFGLTNIEAMACGAALVTTNNGGSRDYAHNGETALVAETGDIDTLVEHVLDLIRHEDRCNSIAQAGVDFVQHFQWERTGELLDEFLEQYSTDPRRFGYRCWPSETSTGLTRRDSNRRS